MNGLYVNFKFANFRDGLKQRWWSQCSYYVLLLSRPTIPTCAFHPSASSCSSVCTTSHDDTSAFSLCDGKLVVLCITDLSVGQANISNAEQLSFCRGASKSRNETKRETKWNRSHAHNNYKFAHLSVRVWPLYRASTATSGSFVSSSIVNQVRLYNAVYVLFIAVILGRQEVCLFSQRAASDVCLSSKLKSMFYVPSDTHKHITVELS